MLEVRNLHTYYGPSHVLHGVSLNVRKGEVVCLLGRNGAGKSTTFKSLIGILKPAEGSVKFNGRELVGLRSFKIARLGLGYVPEDRRVFPNLSVKDNLEIVGWRTGASPWTLGRIYSIFPKLEVLKDGKAMSLSGGEQQMLTVARALMTNPQLLLLDEPSEGLAPVIVQAFGRFIQEVKGELAILVAEQNANFALGFSDRAYMIEKGRISYESDAQAIREDPEVLKKHLAL